MGESLLMHNVTATSASSTKITFGSSAFLWHIPRLLKPEEGAVRRVFPIKLRLRVCVEVTQYSQCGGVFAYFFIYKPKLRFQRHLLLLITGVFSSDTLWK